MKKMAPVLMLSLFALPHFISSASQFEIKHTFEQKNVPALVATPVAIATDGSLLALEYRELNNDENIMLSKVSVWNVATGQCDKRINGTFEGLINLYYFDGYLVKRLEENKPFYSENSRRLGVVQGTRASKANVRAKAISYIDTDKENKIKIYSNEISIIKISVGRNKPLIRLSPSGQLLAMTTESGINIINTQSGEIFQQLPSYLVQEAGRIVIVFFFEFQDLLHFAVVGQNKTFIWFLLRAI